MTLAEQRAAIALLPLGFRVEAEVKPDYLAGVDLVAQVLQAS